MPTRIVNLELLKRIRANEIDVLVCVGSLERHPDTSWATIDTTCEFCNGPIHMDAENMEIAKAMARMCHLCYFEEMGIDSYAKLEQLCQSFKETEEEKILVGGQKLKLKEAEAAIEAMIKHDNDPPN